MKTSASTFSDQPLSACLMQWWGDWLWSVLVWGGLSLMLAVVGCAKVGPPVPPPRFTLAAAGELTATQYGHQIVLRFTATDRAARADVLRRIEPRDAPLPLSEDRFVQEARLIGSLTGQELASGVPPAYTDTFDPQDTSWQDRRIRYAIRLVDARGRSAPLSEYALVYPALAVAEPPHDLQAEVTQDALHLRWQPPAQNVDASPATDVRFNVYRRTQGSALESRRNGAPLAAPQFTETEFVFGETYEYVVRAVSYVQGRPIESRPTPALVIRPVDTFPPAAPTNVTGACAAGIVSLFFPSSPASDLRGYIIYRSERGTSAPPTKLTPTPIPRTTFQDLTGVRGKVYLYFVTAVDVFGNESERSQPVEVEVVP